MEKIKRICFYGGPGSGKSTLSSYVFSQFKLREYNCEYIGEYVKFWTFINKQPKDFDQIYIQAKQIYREDTILRSGVDFIICESPLILQYFYATYYDCPLKKDMLSIAMKFEKFYPSLNIFISRPGDKKFQESGRFQKKEEAIIIDHKIKNILDDNKISYKVFSRENKDDILDYVLNEIKGSEK